MENQDNSCRQSEDSADASTKMDRAEKKRSRRLERDKLMESLPKVDENGISYTKHQLRRMCKRVARGLNPVETTHETSLRLQQEAQTQREEEEELAGLIHRRPASGDSIVQGELETVAETERSGTKRRSGGDAAVRGDDLPHELEGETAQSELTQSKKKSRRSKTVPGDYICAACQNRNKPSHWIYDCFEKVTVRGANTVAKKMKGIQNPDSRKVFVSGLPFDSKVKDVTEMFLSCGKVANCKLLTFEDTRRCKGQAIISFDAPDGARKALGLSGKSIENPRATEKSEGDNKGKRTALKLKVTRALNRVMSKRT